MMKLPTFAAALATLTACNTVPATNAAPDGSLVALGEAVRNGEAVLTAIEIGEDSRCPVGAQCIWPGRVTLLVEVERNHTRQLAWVTLGEGTLVSTETPGAYYAFTLDEVRPAKTADAIIAPADYRFRFGT